VGGDLRKMLSAVLYDGLGRLRFTKDALFSHVLGTRITVGDVDTALSAASVARPGDGVSGFVLVPAQITQAMADDLFRTTWPVPTLAQAQKLWDAALSAAPSAKIERVRHVKRGTEYEVLGEAEAQVAKPLLDIFTPTAYRPLREGNRITVYRDPKSGILYCRFTDEFRDGRFVPAAAPAADGGRA